VQIGDIYWIELPSRGGREQTGRRPGIVWQNQEASASLPTVIVIPLTSQLSALRFPGTALIEKSEKNQLRQNSVALLFQITVIDKTRLRGRLGRLSDDEITLIRETWSELTTEAEIPEGSPA
jgi:mRNA interferase MazF